MPGWLDEIDLDPSGTWRRMATRRLRADEPWLTPDAEAPAQLALKAGLLRDRRDDVLVAPDDCRPAGAEALTLVEAAVGGRGAADLHPLEAASLLVQDDLCLLARRSTTWDLVAGSVCFPSRWRLTEKVGRSVTDVHEPVDGYDPDLAGRVTTLFDRLGETPVARRNWFVHPDPALFQPDRPPAGDPVVPAARCRTELYLRSEHQTLRRLPATGGILFTIRIQQAPLGALLDRPDGTARFARYLRDAPADQLAHRGIGPEQVDELARALPDG